MSNEPNEIDEPWWSRYKWLLPVVLALVVVLIILGYVLASHRDSKPAKATPTPSVPATATATTIPTAPPTQAPSPTPTVPPTPTSTPTSTPTPTPTRIPSPTPTLPPTPTPSVTPVPTVVGLTLGYIHRSPARIQQIQSNASAGIAGYKIYLDPLMVLHSTLPSYRFTGPWQIILPPQPSTTPTVAAQPYTTRDGIPAEKYIVRYAGHTYAVVLEQLANTGTTGVWLISQVGPQLT